MHPTDLPGQPGVVPPGAIGHNRGVVGRNFAFIPPEGVLKSRLPAWKSATVRFLAAPSLGAGFAQYMLEIEPAGGTAQPIQSPDHQDIPCLQGCQASFQSRA
jgi:(S)-ureidoglycine aminohydrolase